MRPGHKQKSMSAADTIGMGVTCAGTFVEQHTLLPLVEFVGVVRSWE